MTRRERAEWVAELEARAHANPIVSAMMTPPPRTRHRGLFLVSPLAWAIKKTWNGTEKRP